MKRFRITNGNRSSNSITFEVNGKEVTRKVNKKGIIRYNSKKYFPIFENYYEGYVAELPQGLENIKINNYFDFESILNGVVENFKQYEVQNSQTKSGNFLISHSGDINVFEKEIQYGSYFNLYYQMGVKVGTEFFRQLSDEKAEELKNTLNYIMLIAAKKLYIISNGEKVELFQHNSYGSNFCRYGIATTC